MGGFDLKSLGLDNPQENLNFGNSQNLESNVNTFDTTGSKITTTKVTKSSYVSPTQSYSYNYSFNLPTTTSSTMTKTTYSEVQK